MSSKLDDDVRAISEPPIHSTSLPRDYDGHNLLFIVGCPRSGTTWLQRLVASHPKVRTGRESHLFHWYLGPMIKHWDDELKDRNVGMGNYLQEEEFSVIIRDFMLRLLEPMVGQLKDGEVFVEKTPDHGHYIKEISEVLPQSRFIHIIRDGRDVTASMLAISKGWGRGWAPGKSGAAASTWASNVRMIRDSAKSLPPDKFLEVRYETMWSEPERTLSQVAKFMGLSWDDQGIEDAVRRNDARTPSGNRTPIRRGGAFAGTGARDVKESEFVRSGVPGNWKKELSWTSKVRFWLTARNTMREMGYKCEFPL